MKNKVLQEDMADIFNRNIEWSKLNKKTILLTGAYGMIASYIVYYILYLNNEKNMNIHLITVVRNRDKFYKKFNGVYGIDDIEVIQSDLATPLQIEKSVDFIIHAASLASPQYYGICPVDVIQPNVIGNYYLLQLAKEKKVEGYLLFSTGDVYGAVNPELKYIDENSFGHMDTLDIHNCYSESKRLAETMCKAFNVQYGVPTRIARIFHTYAPTIDVNNDPRVFASFVKNIVDGEDIIMKSNGLGKRSFCYITDAIAGYFAVLLYGKDAEAYNVCNTDQFISIRDLSECLVSLYPNRKLKVIMKKREKSENYVENVLLLGNESIPDNKKLMELNWAPKVSVREGFDRVVRYIEDGKHK